MSGTKPKFLENQTLPNGYFEKPNPYENAPASKVNLLELSRYAKKHGKKLSDLTLEEINRFSI